MRTPAAAIAWEFRTRHRWGLIAIAAYLAVLAVCRVRLSDAPEYHSVDTFAFFVVVPLTATFIYFLAVFSYGHGGDLAGRQSIFPPRMFTLPVSDTALAGWPMLFGTIVMALLWLATRVLALWPKGAEVPTVWPALLAASLLAWTQALTWMPYPLPGMRVILTILWLASIDAIVLVALHYRAHEWMMLGILAPNLPLAFVVARYAVGRARRGGASSVLGPQSSVLRSARHALSTNIRGLRTEDRGLFYSVVLRSQSSRMAAVGERPLRRGFSRIVAKRSATPHERNVVAATMKKCVRVERSSRKTIASGTAMPITMMPTISRGPDTGRFYPALLPDRL